MKNYRPFLALSLVALLVGACGAPSGSPTPTVEVTATPGLPTPIVYVTSTPDYQSAISLFLENWQKGEYAAMYALLTDASKQNITEENFIKRYSDATNEMALKELRYEVLSATVTPSSAQTNLRYTYVSNVVAEFQRDVTMGLRLVDGGWKIDWEEGLIMPELRGGNVLYMDYSLPVRGDIFDRNGNALVKETEAVAIGMNPAFVNVDNFGTLKSLVSQATGVSQGTIQEKYDAFFGQDWYVSLGEASKEQAGTLIPGIASLSGIITNEYKSRYYFNTAAPQTIGYVGAVQAEEVNEYRRRGYSAASLVGRTGIEQWGEAHLAGRAGGTLYVTTPAPGSAILSSPGRSDPLPGGSLTLTLDSNLQAQALAALSGMRGAVVVMERDTGRILAMASSPGFDPNLFNPNNTNAVYGLGDVVNNPNNPLYNRATEGQYPLGSVFKIITMAAALESGTFTPESKYMCSYEYTELPGSILYDWTWEHCQDELRTEGACTTQPSGELTLSQGLMRSCNPWFYHIGYEMNRQGRVNAVADMARGFGLGAPTGLKEIAEQPGNISNPTEPRDAVNQAIGQGSVTVTPLQVARFIAAIGNGGTLYRPQLVEKSISPEGIETQVFKPEAMGTLPIKPETLDAIQIAMRAVIDNPRGTAVHRFRNMKTIMFGKTGTAQADGLPHSWFAGYTNSSENSDLPDIAIAVLVENRGEGSEYAAPIFRRIVEVYYTGRPQALYWWETHFGITRTPTPFGFEGTATAEAANEP